MATVVDSLMVTLGIDATPYKRGSAEIERVASHDEDKRKQRDSARERADKRLGELQYKRAQQLQSYSKKTEDTFRKIRNQALALAGVFTAGVGVAAFAKDSIRSLVGLHNAAALSGVGAGKLAAYGLALKEIGGTAEEARGQILKMSQDATQARMGMPNASFTAFMRYGGDSAARSSTSAYLQGASALLQRYAQGPGGQPLARMVGESMGLSDSMILLLEKGPQQLDLILARTQRLTDVTGDMSKQGMKAQRAFADLTSELANTGRHILIDLMPSILKVTKYLERMAEWVAGHQTTITAWIDKAIRVFERFARQVQSAVNAVGGWKNVLIGLAALKIASMASGVLSLAAAFLRLSAALIPLSLNPAVLTLLALLAAGAAGYGIGSVISHFIEGTKVDDFIGKTEAEALGAMGDKTASHAVKQNNAANAMLTRGIRNNNPGNIRYGAYAKSHGATGGDSLGFAIFKSMEDGVEAAYDLIKGYVSRGYDTIASIIKRYAPSSENDTAAYTAYVAKKTGIGANTKLSANQIDTVANSMFAFENGKAWARYVASHGAVDNSSTSTVTTHIGQINIHTQATDAKGVARSIAPAVKNSLGNLNWQANTGMG